MAVAVKLKTSFPAEQQQSKHSSTELCADMIEMFFKSWICWGRLEIFIYCHKKAIVFPQCNGLPQIIGYIKKLPFSKFFSFLSCLSFHFPVDILYLLATLI